jgi:hypothetical protein
LGAGRRRQILGRGGFGLAKVGRWFSEAIFSRRSFWAAMNKLILMSGFTLTRSDIRSSQLYAEKRI